ncbi:nodulation protein NodH [Pseudorhodobacter ferrugineus]|uniref:nodulation protein NodH n=1 Tax=Pseudorhodobacter ferrugineus TaxID=77008 RepID=UPI0003B78553|nr:nodulation protein NodH [Pseudorhodobacter ferrugineus]
MERKFDSFVLLAEMRTGSNFLEANLNAMPNVACNGEAFNPHFIGKLNQDAAFGVTLAQREADPTTLLREMRAHSPGLSGFRYFHDHDPRVLPIVLADPRCAKVILTRNPVESYVSWKIAQATGQWKLTQAKRLKTAKAHFDAPEFTAHLDQLQDFQLRLMHGLQTSGQTAFYIDYEDINDTDVLNGLARFLGVTGELAAPDDTLKKQNPEEISEKVENYDEMVAALSRLDRFNLARTPNFEPRRAPAIPSFLAAGAALYMPLRGGPEDAVTEWLAALGPVTADFSQKSLRQWLRKKPAHRSFTVLRHPVARAHAGFCSHILTGALPHIREGLIKSYKLALPKIGEPMTLDQHREAFLGFLYFLKLNVAGQTGLRIDPRFASQTAVLQGFAQFQGPDLVLREDSLPMGLGFLAAEIGVACPAIPALPDPSLDLLAQIYDADIESAARDAYSRDYMGYGFTDWR